MKYVNRYIQNIQKHLYTQYKTKKNAIFMYSLAHTNTTIHNSAQRSSSRSGYDKWKEWIPLNNYKCKHFLSK